MGNSINVRNAIVNLVDIAKVETREHQRDQAQRQLFALTMQKETHLKETQVQDLHRSESAEVHNSHERKAKSGRRPKSEIKKTRINEDMFSKKSSVQSGNHIIDLKA